ncbi:collagen-like protein [Aulosira sp. FACHB-615]|uniref:collagen-like triple helix repeat-containing protein n=1 Tax=Aulosira sp. FACHB-615 TaxID=2692777 RepID=UPI001683DC04|nr:collagen-like protein [Aulosira sp. FACHB-615]MBD2489438.1 collagen-like protein [Aulosira sp. FACHB-615]
MMPININDDEFPAANDDTLNLVQIVKSLVYLVKRITGKSSWKHEPDLTLDALNSAFLDGTLKGEKGDKGDTGEQGSQGIQGEKGDKGDPGSNANVTPGAWQTPTLQNGWSTFDVTPKYRKLADGRLEVKGSVKFNSIPALPSTIFTLPVGYRPIEIQRLSCVTQFNAENRAARIAVGTDGAVFFTGVSNATVTNTSISNFPLNFVCPLD